MELIDVEIEKAFIEKQLGIALKSISAKKGSKPGDNYMSNIYAIKAYSHESKEPLHLFLKVFPQHPERQRTLKIFNIFRKEIDAYENIIPSLASYQKGPNILLPRFAKYISGDAVNYAEKSKREGKAGIYENFILLEDIRAQGFSMADRHKGVDFEHATSMIKELAKLHALSWGLRVNRKQTIREMFPLTGEGGFDREQIGEFNDLIMQNYKIMMEVIENKYGVESEIYKGAARLSDAGISDLIVDYMNPPKGKIDHLEMSKLIRAPISSEEELKSFNNDSWNLLCHGDCWINNVLFRYENDKVKEACLVDLQIMRDGCPTTELAYFLYSSVHPDILKACELEILQIYYETFNTVCSTIGVDPLPGFTFENLIKRFHNVKLLGLLLVSAFVPIMLAEPMADLDTSEEGASTQEMMMKMSNTNTRSDTLKQRILKSVEFAFSDGII